MAIEAARWIVTELAQSKYSVKVVSYSVYGVPYNWRLFEEDCKPVDSY